MSGTGQDDFRAPTRLTPIAGDQPIGQGDDGRAVRPSMYFTQLIQRLLSYIGQPTAGNVPGQTLSGQVGALNIATAIIENSPGPAAPSINARVSALEDAIHSQLPLPPPPPPGVVPVTPAPIPWAVPAQGVPRPVPVAPMPSPALLFTRPPTDLVQLASLADVSLQSPADLQLLQYSAADRLWKNRTGPTEQSASVVAGSAVALTTATGLDVTTLTLAAGKWLIGGSVYFTGAAGTTITDVAASLSTVANTLATAPGTFANQYLAGAAFSAIGQDIAVTGMGLPVVLGSSTTYHLVARAAFAVSTLSAYGIIWAVPSL